MRSSAALDPSSADPTASFQQTAHTIKRTEGRHGTKTALRKSKTTTTVSWLQELCYCPLKGYAIFQDSVEYNLKQDFAVIHGIQ